MLVKKILIKTLLIIILFQPIISFACTAFGIITDKGTILAKNRDNYYGKQVFERVKPLRQFTAWYGNPYGHSNEFYALIFKNGLSFGVNQYGLAIIDEDAPRIMGTFPHQKRYMKPAQGYDESMIQYGILQNFASVKEIIPYINAIFSTAAPNFYQIADNKNILTVEVGYGENDKDKTRKFSYKLFNKKGDYFIHTNFYLSPEFNSFNNLPVDIKEKTNVTSRFKKIDRKIKNSKGYYNQSFNWFLDTKSDVGISGVSNFCLDTSLFRSYLGNLTGIHSNTEYDKVYGTVSSFLFKNETNNQLIHLRIIDSIDVLKNGNQKVTYRELTISLNKLFTASNLLFEIRSFIRLAPVNEKCR